MQLVILPLNTHSHTISFITTNIVVTRFWRSSNHSSNLRLTSQTLVKLILPPMLCAHNSSLLQKKDHSGISLEIKPICLLLASVWEINKPGWKLSPKPSWVSNIYNWMWPKEHVKNSLNWIYPVYIYLFKCQVNSFNLFFSD